MLCFHAAAAAEIDDQGLKLDPAVAGRYCMVSPGPPAPAPAADCGREFEKAARDVWRLRPPHLKEVAFITWPGQASPRALVVSSLPPEAPTNTLVNELLVAFDKRKMSPGQSPWSDPLTLNDVSAVRCPGDGSRGHPLLYAVFGDRRLYTFTFYCPEGCDILARHVMATVEVPGPSPGVSGRAAAIAEKLGFLVGFAGMLIVMLLIVRFIRRKLRGVRR
jgi:hypothetical protein